MKVLIHSNGPHVPSGYGRQARYAGRILRDLGHEVAFSCFSGLGGSPIRWDGYTLFPSGALDFSPDMVVPHALTMGADLVIPIMDFHKLSPAATQWRQAIGAHPMQMAAFIISDCVAENGGPSMLDQQTIPMFGAYPVAVSQFGMQRLKALGYGTAEFPCSYVPHCVDASVYKPPADRLAARKELGTRGDFVIGIMAANSDGIRKNFQGQFAAFQRFSRRHKDAYLAVFSVADSPRGLPLGQMAHDMGIEDRVVFMPSYEQIAGMAPDEMCAAWYGSLDVLSLCSYGEGFGIPLIDAQACGTPVVGTDCSAITELVRPAGFLVPGHRFWNVTHRAWWAEAFEDDILRAWEKAYQTVGPESNARAREIGLRYDINVVRDTCWSLFMQQMEDLSSPSRVVEHGGLKWRYDDSFQYGDRLAFGHEEDIEEIVFRGLAEDGTFLDIGAHVGHYSLRAARRCRRVIAVEANPETARRLEENAALNGIDNITVLNLAAWDEEGTLTVSTKHGHNHDGTDNVIGDGEPVAEVTARRMDVAIQGIPIDVIKIDVEGADLAVIRGLAEILTAHKPRLFIEDHSVYGLYERSALDALLASYGYAPRDAAKGYVEALPVPRRAG